MPTATAAAIALGSNLGPSLQTLTAAIAAIDARSDTVVTARSPWYRTPPIGPVQPDYLNGCILLETSLTPEDLLQALLAIELSFGRERRERWGPRTLDLDLLLYGDRVLATPSLQLPHPRMHERAFVLVPLAEIAPDWQHPLTGKTVRTLRDGVNCSGICPIETP